MDYQNLSSSDYSSRTAGLGGQQVKSIQSWKSKSALTPPPQNIQEVRTNESLVSKDIVSNLNKAAQGKIGIFDTELQNVQAYAPAHAPIQKDVSITQKNEDTFSFGDVVDVINPLQHLPVVSMVYRGITGDKLHPMAQIIGGALYGGPVGAVTGTINAISQVQTGKDIGDHAMGLVGLGSKQTTNLQKLSGDLNSPAEQLNKTVQKTSSFVPDTTAGIINPLKSYTSSNHIEVAQGRTAGKMPTYNHTANYSAYARHSIQQQITAIHTPSIDVHHPPKREPVTSINFKPMPAKDLQFRTDA